METDAHQAEVNAAAGDVTVPARTPAAPAAARLIQQRPLTPCAGVVDDIGTGWRGVSKHQKGSSYRETFSLAL